MSKLMHLADYRRSHRRGTRIYFTREELGQLIQLYSLHVARGEWRDYAIDHLNGMAVFSVFRHTAETPLYSIAKIQHSGESGTHFTAFEGQRKLKQSRELREVITPLAKNPMRMR